jgi:pseudaminic acid synthase
VTTKQKGVFVVAEISANHRQDLEVALRTIRAAKESGADAVKIQTYTPDTITIDCDNEYFRIKHGTLWDGRTLYDLYKEAYTPWDWHDKLQKAAEERDLVFFSTPFDFTAVEFLESLHVPLYKIASFEITDIPLIERIARTGKPVMFSTGIATLADIEAAVNALRGAGVEDITILHCTSSYPAPVEDANLRTMQNNAVTFGTKVGLSDHTVGWAVPAAAVAMGAIVVEKHFILDRTLGGPDAAFSAEPAEFRTMVDAIRAVEKALGRVTYTLSDASRKNRVFSRSLFVVNDMAGGELFAESNIRSIRPGNGLPPRYLPEVLGRRARCEIKRGTPLRWDHIE